jgi:transcriptional regulator with XRE-family HTH domain
LAKLTGIKQQNISRWENNKAIPSIENCEILADFYGITIDELIGRDEIKNKKAVIYNHSTHNGNNIF